MATNIMISSLAKETRSTSIADANRASSNGRRERMEIDVIGGQK